MNSTSNSEGTLLAESADHTDRSNCRWERWEIGMLICLALKGKTLDEIAPSMNRTIDAVRREWARLLQGQVDCPTEYEEDLRILRKKYPNPNHNPKTSASEIHAQTTEQYKELTLRLDRLAGQFLEDRLINELMLANNIRHKTIDVALINASGMRPDTIKRVMRIAQDMDSNIDLIPDESVDTTTPEHSDIES